MFHCHPGSVCFTRTLFCYHKITKMVTHEISSHLNPHRDAPTGQALKYISPIIPSVKLHSNARRSALLCLLPCWFLLCHMWSIAKLFLCKNGLFDVFHKGAAYQPINRWFASIPHAFSVWSEKDRERIPPCVRSHVPVINRIKCNRLLTFSALTSGMKKGLAAPLYWFSVTFKWNTVEQEWDFTEHICGSSWRLISHFSRRPWQEKDGLLTPVGVWSRLGLPIPLQPHVPRVLLGAIRVVMVFFILLQEVTLIVQCWLRTWGRGEKGRAVGFVDSLLIGPVKSF